MQLRRRYIDISVEVLKNDAEWTAFLKAHPQASFYHTLKWRDIVEKTFGYRKLYLLIKNPAGCIVGVCPGFIKSQIGFKIYDSLPYSDYGGPIIENSFRQEGMALLVNFLSEYCSTAGIEYGKFYFQSEDGFHSLLKQPSTYIERPIGTMEINLGITSSDFLWNKVYSGTQRKRIRRIEREGNVVQEAKSKSDLLEFYNLYLQNMAYIGGSPDPYELIEEIWNKLFPNYLRLWLLRNGKLIGAEFFLKTEKSSYSRYATVDRKSAGNVSISSYLRWMEIKKSEQEKRQLVSLGTTTCNPSDQHYIQKRRAGATFHQQEVVWYPFTGVGYTLLRVRGKIVPIWKADRNKLPGTIRKLMEQKLLKL
jgi:predicted N-acyltransferase